MKMTTIFYDENKLIIKTLKNILYQVAEAMEIRNDLKLYKSGVVIDEFKEDEIIRKIYLVPLSN
jgi:hypothetical protein